TILDQAGTEVASADDQPVAGREAPVVRPLIIPQTADDALYAFEGKPEGDFVVMIEDIYGFSGKAYGYRLEIAQAPVDFDLLVQPSVARVARPAQGDQQQQQQGQQVLSEFAGAGTGSLTMDRGGSGALVVRAIRNGYTGDIDLV